MSLLSRRLGATRSPAGSGTASRPPVDKNQARRHAGTMPAPDVNSLFSRAEQAFLQGRADDARRDLLQVQRLVGDDPAVLHLLALVEKKRGDAGASRQAFERA